MYDAVLVLLLKAGLWCISRAALPLLFGQAKHASLDASATPRSSGETIGSLPHPATSTSSSSFISRSIHDDDQDNHPVTASHTSPFLKHARPQLGSLHSVQKRLSNALTWNDGYGGLDLQGFSAALFSLAFEECATLYLAVLLEIAGFTADTGSATRIAWAVSLVAVVFLAVILIPLGFCLLFTYRSHTSTPLLRRLLYLSLPLVPWLLLFFNVPLPSALTSPDSKAGIRDRLVARTAVIGVTLIALLSGSAAMAAAWEAFMTFTGKALRPPSPSDIQLAHESFARARSDLETRKKELDRLENEAELARSQKGSGGGWSLSSMWGGDARSREIKTLKSEIFGLTSIATAMREDLDRMKELAKRQRRSRTLGGKLLTAIGWGWAVYCGFRVVLSLLNLLVLGYKDTTPPDFVSMALASFLRIFDVKVDVAVWTRQISLVFVGVLIWARIGSVLSVVGSTFRAASTGVSTCFLVLFLSEVMTIYLLATLIQLRTTLPPSLSLPTPDQAQSSGPLLASLPSFQVVFGALFDSAFLLAATVTATYKWAIEAQRTSVGDGGALFGGGAGSERV